MNEFLSDDDLKRWEHLITLVADSVDEKDKRFIHEMLLMEMSRYMKRLHPDLHEQERIIRAKIRDLEADLSKFGFDGSYYKNWRGRMEPLFVSSINDTKRRMFMEIVEGEIKRREKKKK